MRKTAVFILAVVSCGIFFSSQAHAADLSQFNAGRIIDDSVMTNTSTMSVQQIQNFLNSKLSTCDTSGSVNTTYYYDAASGMYGSRFTSTQVTTSRAIQGQRYDTFWRTHPNERNAYNAGWVEGDAAAPYTCLKDYRVGDGRTAAQVIYDAAQKWQINPQVLLVLLQKENSLLTDDYPWPLQMRTATGYGCPDPSGGGGVVCSSQYHGLANQLDWAAKLFRKVIDRDPNWYSPYTTGTNYIQWSPNASCGGSNVNVQNWSTASLYDYTPYQPNAAALAAGSGQGDACSAHGNRNFYIYFNDWFGSTIGPSYAAVYSAESAFPTLEHNQKSTVFIRYKNMGSQNWYDSATAASQGTYPVVLATLGPINRCSTFVDVTWYNCSRPTGLFSKVYEADGVTLAADQHVAKPTEIVEYSFVVNAPDDTYTGTHAEYFAPIRESAPGWSWYMGANNVFLNVNVTNAYRASYSGQSPYPTISQNDRSKAFVRMKNTGSAAWHDTVSAAQAGRKPVVLATEGPVNRPSVFGASWDAYARRPSQIFSKVLEADGTTLAADQHIAQPGQIAEYEFLLTPLQTTNPGFYREYFRVIREGAKTFSVDNSGVHLDVTVRKSVYGASYAGQSSYPVMNRSTSSNIYFDLRNTGTTTWYDDHAWTPGILTVRLATTWPINRSSTFYDPSWFVSSRPKNVFSQVFESDGVTLSSNQHAALPNQVVRYEFPIKAPSTPGTYYEHFQPVVEGSPGSSWDMGGLVWTKITVQ